MFIIDRKVSSCAFFTAFLAFILMSLVMLLHQSSDPFHEMLALEKEKAVPGFVSIYFFLDFLLVSSWLLGWFAVSHLFKDKQMWLQKSVFIAGIIGPLLDYTETIISIVLIFKHRGEVLSPITLYQAWVWTNGLSYYIPYLTALILGLLLLQNKRSNRWAAWVCILGLPAGILGYFWSLADMISYLWWPLWFLAMGIILKNEGKISKKSD